MKADSVLILNLVEAVELLIQAVKAGAGGDVVNLASAPRQAARPFARLSAREHEVVRLLARGYTNREIAEVLVVSQSTVKVHVEHILTKLAVSDRTQAAVRAMEVGLIRR